MPKVTIRGAHGRLGVYANTVDVLTGTYWMSILDNKSLGEAAHDYPLAKEAPKDSNGGEMLIIDNGIMLVQPDHKSYLLIDGGCARPKDSEYHSASTVAKAISQSMGFGDTELLQPSPGIASDNFASGTIFKTGSVIAIYNDTPQLYARELTDPHFIALWGPTGNLALTQSIVSVGLKLTWDAQN
jgi:hypothetical protein